MKHLIPAVLLLAATCLPAQSPVRVTGSRELVQALGSDRTVFLAPGEYLLSGAGQVSNPGVSWRKVFDGLELVITGLRNLSLRAERGATILASPGKTDVRFDSICQRRL